jgi:hypothetical protein
VIEKFCNTLEGLYDNWKQSSKNPIKYSYCHLYWERIGENELISKQWYESEGKDNPYRNRWHRVNIKNDTIVVENWSPEWKDHNPCCDMLFFAVEDYYTGIVSTRNCIVNGGTVKSMVEFDGKSYKSKDQGWKDGKVVWGSDFVYEFEKKENTYK